MLVFYVWIMDLMRDMDGGLLEGLECNTIVFSHK